MDSYRSHPWRCRPRLSHPRRIHAPQRPFLRSNGEGRIESLPGCTVPGGDLVDHDHPSGGARIGCREGARRKSMGRFHRRGNHPHRPPHGPVPAICPAWKNSGRFGARRPLADRSGLGRSMDPQQPCARQTLHLLGRTLGLGDCALRFRRERAACLVTARAARLPQHLHEARHYSRPGRRRAVGAAHPQDARPHRLYRRLGARRSGQTVSILLHHHCLRSHQWFPHTHRQRHHPENYHP